MAEEIYKYNEPFGSDGGTVIIKNGNMLGYGANEGQTIVLEEHYFWGQPYNGQQDVNGDITIDKGNVISGCGDLHMQGLFNDEWELGGNITADNHTKTKTLEVEDEAQVGGSLNVTNNINAGESITAKNANITHTLNADEVRANKGTIKNIEAEDIKTHNLTVTGLAHFFELTIDKISASGGAVIYSPADGFEIERVINQVINSNNGTTYNLPANYYLVDEICYDLYFYYGTDALRNYNFVKVKRYDTGDKIYYCCVSNGYIVDDKTVWELASSYFRDKWTVHNYNSFSNIDGVIYAFNSASLARNYINNALSYPFKVEDEWTGEYDNELVLPDEYLGIYELVDTKIYKAKVMEPDYKGEYTLYKHNNIDIEMRYVIVNEISTNKKFIWDVDGFLNRLANQNIIDSSYKDKYFYDNFSFENLSIMRQSFSSGTTFVYAGFPILRHKYFDRASTYALNSTTSRYTKGNALLLWRTNDGEKARKNMWQVNDQAVCRNFNQAKVGTTQNVSNKYYWSLVLEIGTRSNLVVYDKYINSLNYEYAYEGDEPAEYHYIKLSRFNLDGELNPEPGDEISMLGNRSDVERQKAIYISAYSSMDTSLKPPFIAQYQGINNFSLYGKKTTWFAANGNRILGDLVIESTGKSVEDTIDDNIGDYNEKIDGIKDRLHLKVLPAREQHMSYDDWYSQIGKVYYWETPVGVDVEEFKVGGVRRNNVDLIYDVTDGLNVLIENTCSHKYSYSNKTYSEDTDCKITIYGQIETYTPKRDGSCGWGIRVLHILDGDLQTVWDSMAMIRVTQDGITLKVQDLDAGIAALQIKANQIQSSVSNLETNMNSKLSQTADELRFEINEVAKLIVNDTEIILNEDTIVNGNVTIPQPYEFDMISNEGVTHLQSKTIGDLESFYSTSHSTQTISFTKTVSIPDWQAGTGSGGRNTTAIWPSYDNSPNLITINAKTNNWQISLSNHTCTNLSFTNPNNNLNWGGRGYQNSWNVYIYNSSGTDITDSVYKGSTNGEKRYTFANAGTYKIKIVQPVGMNYTDSNRDGIPDNGKANGAKLTGTTTVLLTQPASDGDTVKSKSCLGTDGYSANFGNGGVIWMGKDQTSLNYGDYEFCIKNDGVYKRYPESTSSGRGSYNANKLVRLKDVVIDTGTTPTGNTECLCPGTNITLPNGSTISSGTRIIILGGHYNGANGTSSGTNVTYNFRGRSHTVTVADGQIMTFIFSSGGWWHD